MYLVNKQSILVVFFLVLMSSNSEAASVRDYIEKYLGKNIATKIWGEKVIETSESDIPFPKIPELTEDAKSQQTYLNKEKLGSKQISKEERSKYDAHFIREIVSVILNRKAHDLDYDKWLNVLDQGGSREGVYRALVLGDAYKGLEQEKLIFAPKVLKFSEEYLKKFLAKEIKEKSLRYYDFYALKRVVVGKSLELLDLFSDDDLVNWFAHFSVYLSKNYPKAFKVKLRLSENIAEHQAWAKSMPEQLIKSEVMIRLHLVFNLLQTED